jgi:hypothetical protein
MLKSYEAIYDRGHLKWLGDAPVIETARVIVTVLIETTTPHKGRQPPPELKGSVTWLGDPFEPAISVEEWEASLERTARQIAGDPEAFK